jgi:uncharacterized protein
VAKVSLLGSQLAKVGSSFVFLSPCQVAGTCPVARTCQNLEVGHAYRVLSKRPIHHDVCTEHEGGVDAVEVEALPVVASLEISKLKGTLAKWAPLKCGLRGCVNWSTCFNPAMKAEQEYRIEKTLGTMTCPMGYRLERVQVQARRGPGPA